MLWFYRKNSLYYFINSTAANLRRVNVIENMHLLISSLFFKTRIMSPYYWWCWSINTAFYVDLFQVINMLYSWRSVWEKCKFEWNLLGSYGLFWYPCVNCYSPLRVLLDFSWEDQLTVLLRLFKGLFPFSSDYLLLLLKKQSSLLKKNNVFKML